MEKVFEIVFIIAFVVVMTILMSKMDKKLDKDSPKPILDRACPPHKWSYVEQPGMPETFYIKCGLCKKTPTEVGNST